MAKQAVYLSSTDIDDLKQVIASYGWPKKLPKSTVENWAIIYGVAEKTVKNHVERLYYSQYMNNKGKRKFVFKETRGPLTRGCLAEIELAVTQLKRTGQAIDTKAIAQRYKMTEEHVTSIANDMI